MTQEFLTTNRERARGYTVKQTAKQGAGQCTLNAALCVGNDGGRIKQESRLLLSA